MYYRKMLLLSVCLFGGLLAVPRITNAESAGVSEERIENKVETSIIDELGEESSDFSEIVFESGLSEENATVASFKNYSGYLKTGVVRYFDYYPPSTIPFREDWYAGTLQLQSVSHYRHQFVGNYAGYLSLDRP